MINTTPFVALVAALSGAPSFANAEAIGETTRQSAQAQARIEMRVAQVEVYCDHPEQAIQAIQRARRQLAGQTGWAATRELAALDEAAWHVRHRENDAAVAALDASRSRLKG